MNGNTKRQASSKVSNNIEFNNSNSSRASTPALTPPSSNDAEYSKVAETSSRSLQLGPQMIQLSSALRNRLSPGDPMIAAWDELIDILQKGYETPTPRAGAAIKRVSDNEKHAAEFAPSHAPSCIAEVNKGPIQRLCDYGSNINAVSEFGDEEVNTGIKRTYCESITSEAYSPRLRPEDDRRGGHGLETDAIQGDLPTSNDKCTCEKWRVCDPCYDAGKKCTCNGWDSCDYCRYSKANADIDPWSLPQPVWSTAPESLSDGCTAHSRFPWEYETCPPANTSRSRHSSPVHTTRRATSVPATNPPTHSKYSVTYWATIEYGEQAIHVPIDSDNVSGTEKRVLEGFQGMQKVWGWVVEKDLTDKVGLQDAFDLAMDMRGDPPVGLFSDTDGDRESDVLVKSESGSRYSRRGPLSAKRARLSPSPSDSYSISVASDILSG